MTNNKQLYRSKLIKICFCCKPIIWKKGKMISTALYASKIPREPKQPAHWTKEEDSILILLGKKTSKINYTIRRGIYVATKQMVMVIFSFLSLLL